MKQNSLRQKIISSRSWHPCRSEGLGCFDSLSVTHSIVQRRLAPLNSRVLSLKSTRTITIITIVTCSRGESNVRAEYTPSHTAQILPDLLHISRCSQLRRLLIQFNQQHSHRYGEAKILPPGDKDEEKVCFKTGTW